MSVWVKTQKKILCDVSGRFKKFDSGQKFTWRYEYNKTWKPTPLQCTDLVNKFLSFLKNEEFRDKYSHSVQNEKPTAFKIMVWEINDKANQFVFCFHTTRKKTSVVRVTCPG